MPSNTAQTFFIFFGVAWVFAVLYAGSAVAMALRVRRLQAQGQAAEAPDILNPLECPRGLLWLVTGRFQDLGDPVVAGWARAARGLFFVAGPMILAVFAWTFLAPPSGL